MKTVFAIHALSASKMNRQHRWIDIPPQIHNVSVLCVIVQDKIVAVLAILLEKPHPTFAVEDASCSY